MKIFLTRDLNLKEFAEVVTYCRERDVAMRMPTAISNHMQLKVYINQLEDEMYFKITWDAHLYIPRKEPTDYILSSDC